MLLGLSLFAVRLPALYFSYPSMPVTGSWATYNNALIIFVLSVIPIALYSYYWSISYMMFRKEFTACPGNYNGIHDPTIQMVAMATMIEGALDVLSTGTLMQMATYNLPPQVSDLLISKFILK